MTPRDHGALFPLASLGPAVLVLLSISCAAPASSTPNPFPQASSPASAVPVVSSPPRAAPTPGTLASASFSSPRIEVEVQQVFELNYQARTLQLGGQFGLAALRALVDGPYADYTLPLFDSEIRDGQAGALRQVTFRDIAVGLDRWTDSGEPGAGRAEVTVTRTREEVRAGSGAKSETSTFQFGLQRSRLGTDGVRWSIADFVNPTTGRWLSAPPPAATLPPDSDAQIAAELRSFFDQFYQARTLTGLHALDLRKSEELVAGSYAEYTMPLLRESQAEAESGALKELRYADISVRLEKWDRAATIHGGLATVAVTRSVFATRSTGAEPPRTETLEFRVHRHFHVFPAGPAYTGSPFFVNWLVVDFLRPDVSRWVTDLAGATTIVPDTGHA